MRRLQLRDERREKLTNTHDVRETHAQHARFAAKRQAHADALRAPPPAASAAAHGESVRYVSESGRQAGSRSGGHGVQSGAAHTDDDGRPVAGSRGPGRNDHALGHGPEPGNDGAAPRAGRPGPGENVPVLRVQLLRVGQPGGAGPALGPGPDETERAGDTGGGGRALRL